MLLITVKYFCCSKQLARAAEKGTVEDRIRSNKNYIQRSSGAMDKNFARR
jgi:hypothetical protein